MRFASLIKMLVDPSDLPKKYYYKHVNSQAPSILITMPKRRPEDFYESYVKKFGNPFNIILYSMGFLQSTPPDFKRINIKEKPDFLRGLFSIKNICFS